jgi:oxygen-independent coproporphyrinogen-3 oxidase
VSLDLLFAVPGFGAETLETDLETAVELGPDHVSLYNLTFEPRTMFDRLRRERRIRPHDPESEVSLYRIGSARLRRSGYVHYEVSNFCRPGSPCLYNRHVWRGGDYEAVGPGAAGHAAGRRWRNHRSVDRYLAASEQGESLREEVEVLDRDARVREALFLALRQPRGVRARLIHLRTGVDPLVALAEPLARMRRAGHVAIEGGRIRPTEKGLLLADSLAAEILSGGPDRATEGLRSSDLVRPPAAT